MIALNQIEVSTSSYRWTHGSIPRVRGQWAFAIGCTLKDVENDINKAWWSSYGTYSEACKEAKKEAQKRNVSVIYLLP